MTEPTESLIGRLATKNFLLATIAGILFYATTFYLVLYFDLMNLDSLTKVIDAGFKAAVVIGSSIWALNRYYVLRTDVPQLAVDSEVRLVEFADQKGALLLLWLDLRNTGRILIKDYEHFVEVHSLEITDESVMEAMLYRWPESGAHRGGPIEPGSWTAINDQFRCPDSVRVVRVFLAVRSKAGYQWTWHRSFDVSKEGDL